MSKCTVCELQAEGLPYPVDLECECVTFWGGIQLALITFIPMFSAFVLITGALTGYMILVHKGAELIREIFTDDPSSEMDVVYSQGVIVPIVPSVRGKIFIVGPTHGQDGFDCETFRHEDDLEAWLEICQKPTKELPEVKTVYERCKEEKKGVCV
jgi:hypothetical protein